MPGKSFAQAFAEKLPNCFTAPVAPLPVATQDALDKYQSDLKNYNTLQSIFANVRDGDTGLLSRIFNFLTDLDFDKQEVLKQFRECSDALSRAALLYSLVSAATQPLFNTEKTDLSPEFKKLIDDNFGANTSASLNQQCQNKEDSDTLVNYVQQSVAVLLAMELEPSRQLATDSKYIQALNDYTKILTVHGYPENLIITDNIERINQQNKNLLFDVQPQTSAPFLDISTDYIDEQELLQYITQHQDLCQAQDFQYSICKSSIAFLEPLSLHLQSESAYIPFKDFIFTMAEYDDAATVLRDLESVLHFGKTIENITIVCNGAMPEHKLSAIINAINTKIQGKTLPPPIISIELAQVDIAKEQDIITKIQNLGNDMAKAQRNAAMTSSVALNFIKPPVVLGRLGRALFQQELTKLAVETVTQQEVQQQVQQQVPTSIEDSAPDESELVTEVFTLYDDAEQALDKAAFCSEMQEYIAARFPHLEPADCWDLLVGSKYADKFKYAIHKLTAAAAKQLIVHLEDAQFGFHPDNLPQGFVLKQGAQAEMVLTYNALESVKKESPLTPHFSRALQPAHWVGDNRQWLAEGVDALYKKIFTTTKPITLTKLLLRTATAAPPSLEECKENFFCIRDVDDTRVSNAQRLEILKAYIGNVEINAALDYVFDKSLTSQNIAALAEVLYAKGPNGLAQLLNELYVLKDKGPNFFQHFKTCFIDPSKNLNELLTPTAIGAMQDVRTLPKADFAWWQALTMQHASNLALKRVGADTPNRWSNLAELNAAFKYFRAQLQEMQPGKSLTTVCPLENVADMRVGLDRLLTILCNAHDYDEQFYGELHGLSLDALGPFYASRYEGYRLVTTDMRLCFGTAGYTSFIAPVSADEETKFSLPGCVFKSDKTDVATKSAFLSLYENLDLSEIPIFFTRYLATFNHRRPIEDYRAAFKIIHSFMSYDDAVARDNNMHASLYQALWLIVIFGTGKVGKIFSLDDIKKFAVMFDVMKESGVNNVLEFDEKKRRDRQGIMDKWIRLAELQIKPTLVDIVNITHMSLNDEYPEGFLIDLLEKTRALQALGASAEFLQALSKMHLNKSAIQPRWVLASLQTIADEGGSIARLLACVSNEDIDSKEAAGDMIGQCVENIKKCTEINGHECTENLVNILSSIDVERSTKLPSLTELNACIAKINSLSKPNFGTLLINVKNNLPNGCVVNVNATVPISEPTVDLRVVMAANIESIISALQKLPALIQQQLPKDFYAELRAPHGADLLLQSLDKIEKLPESYRALVARPICSVILDIYVQMKNNTSAIIAASSKMTIESRTLLHNIMQYRIQHPLMGAEFKLASFVPKFKSELAALQALTKNFDTISKNWPQEFVSLLPILWNSDMTAIYSLTTLNKLAESFVYCDTKEAFPTQLFTTFFPLQQLSILNDKTVFAIVDFLFAAETDSNSHEDVLSILDKERLCKLAMGYLTTATFSADVTGYLQKVKSLKIKYPAQYQSIVAILLIQEPKNENVVEDVVATVEKIIQSFGDNLATELLDFYREHLDDLKALANIAGVDTQIIEIALKAANIEQAAGRYRNLDSCVLQLQHLEEQTLDVLYSMYKMPHYPAWTVVQEYFTNIDALVHDFDLDPYHKRPEALKEQFDTAQVDDYINALNDLNAAPKTALLFTKRAQLQKWFLYINAIGCNYKLHGVDKAIKDLIHKEITALLDKYRASFQDNSLSLEDKMRARLEVIALMREVMYRTTGKFPHPTQILYLLNAMQREPHDFAAQMQTGEGKSLTSALMSALLAIEGNAVDVATSSQFLAGEGVHEHKDFFAYLGIPAILINSQTSTIADIRCGAINYGSVDELVLRRIKLELQGAIFPDKYVISVDELDDFTLDVNKSYHVATPLDINPNNPYESPYVWMYEAIIAFADAQKTPLTDDELLAEARIYLQNAADGAKKRQQLQDLQANRQLEKRLPQWIVAAAQTKKLAADIVLPDAEAKRSKTEVHYRIKELEHPRYGVISKACVLNKGRPDIVGEFSESIQQFLHLRLRAYYSADTRPPFLVEPEKAYAASMNARIFLSRYLRRFGMSGTLGSVREIKELHSKYGWQCVEIPPFKSSNCIELAPILTNAQLLSSPLKESNDHIELIVKDVLRVIQEDGPHKKCSPILVMCIDKEQGDRIAAALNIALGALSADYKNNFLQPQVFYSSTESTEELRLQEETKCKNIAGFDGAITISTVFGRGTDIKPTHVKGLYAIQEQVDTQPYSFEDLERSRGQKFGRVARRGSPGRVRLILRRSEFCDAYPHDKKQVKRIPATINGVNLAIRDLNAVRSSKRTVERSSREAFEGLKEYVYQEFKQSKISHNWSEFRHGLDAKWAELRVLEDKDAAIVAMVDFVCATCSELNINKQDVLAVIYKQQAPVRDTYVPTRELYGKLDLIEAEAYCDMTLSDDTQVLRTAVVMQRVGELVKSPLPDGYGSDGPVDTMTAADFVKDTLSLLLQKHKEAYLAGQYIDNHQYRLLMSRVTWSANIDLQNAVIESYRLHINALIAEPLSARGAFYLQSVMSDLGQFKPDSLVVAAKAKYAAKWMLQCRSSMWSSLKTYKEQSWIFGDVSLDRRDLATQLCKKLIRTDLTVRQILEYLYAARKQLLDDDRAHHRNFAASLNGRLNSMIEVMRSRVIAVSAPAVIDDLITMEFNDLMQVLAVFENSIDEHLRKKSNTLRAITETDTQAKFNAAMRFFSEVEAHSLASHAKHDEASKAFYSYCRQRQNGLMDFCNQGQELRKLSQAFHIAVYRAAVEASGDFLQSLAKSPVSVQIDPDEITHREQTIYCVNILPKSATIITNSAFFRQIYQPDRYKSLLLSIESIWMESHHHAEIIFNAIIVTPSEYFNDDGFKLEVFAQIDKHFIVIPYHFNVKTAEVYCYLGALEAMNTKIHEYTARLEALKAPTSEISRMMKCLMNQEEGQGLIESPKSQETPK